jgi:small subunit ribosomal protein S11
MSELNVENEAKLGVEEQVVADASKVETKPSRKSSKKMVSEGVVTIFAHFNNTVVTIADRQGNVLCWSTPSKCGFKGSRKSTPFAAGKAAEEVAIAAKEKFSMRAADVKIRGAGMGREAAIKSLQAAGLKILSIEDTTGIPHNGCRPKKKRRV